MKKYACFAACLSLLLSSCHSTKSRFTFSSAPVYVSGPEVLLPETAPAEPSLFTAEATSKMIAFSAPKVLFTSPATRNSQAAAAPIPETLPKPLNTALNPEKLTRKITQAQEHDPEKVRGKKLSGIFLAAGTLLLLGALGFALAGISGAAILAWSGGGLLLAGFIFTLVALLGR